MSLIRHTLAVLAVGIGATTTLPAAPLGGAIAAPARSCFYVTQISNTRAADARTLYLRVSRSVYRVDMMHDCEGLRPTSQTILLEPIPPSGQICGPLNVNLTVGEHGTAQRCMIADIVKLSPEEAAALPKSVSP
jgi:hypothetical protein